MILVVDYALFIKTRLSSD